MKAEKGNVQELGKFQQFCRGWNEYVGLMGSIFMIFGIGFFLIGFVNCTCTSCLFAKWSSIIISIILGMALWFDYKLNILMKRWLLK